MPLLQWNEVAAPNMTGVAQMLQQRQASWDAAFSNLQGVLGQGLAMQQTRGTGLAANAIGGMAGQGDVASTLAQLQAIPLNQRTPEVNAQIASLMDTGIARDQGRADIGLTGGQTALAYSSAGLNDQNARLVDANRLSVLGGERRTDELHTRAIGQEDSAIALNGIVGNAIISGGNNTLVGGGGAAAAPQAGGLGSLSGKYEGSYDTVGGDGGRAYGRYQFDGPAGGLNTFFQAAPQYAQQFAGLEPGTAEFNSRWQQLSRTDPGFNAAQDAAASQRWYAPAAETATGLGFQMNNRGVQEAVFSGSIQHGGIDKILQAAAQTPGFAQMSPQQQIEAFYNARGNYVVNEGGLSGDRLSGVINRYDSERRDALSLSSGAAVSPEQGGGTGVAQNGAPTSTGPRINAPMDLDYGTMTPAQIAEMWGSVGAESDLAMDQSIENQAASNLDRQTDQDFLEQSLDFGRTQTEQASIDAGTRAGASIPQRADVLSPADAERAVMEQFPDDPIAQQAALQQIGIAPSSVYEAPFDPSRSSPVPGAEGTVAAYAQQAEVALSADPMVQRFDQVQSFEGISGTALADAVKGQMPELTDMPPNRILRAIQEVMEKTGVSEQMAAASLLASPHEVGIWEGMTTFGGIERGEIILDSDRASEIARQMADPATVLAVQERRGQSQNAIATAQADLATLAEVTRRNDLAESRGQGRPQQAQQDALTQRIMAIGNQGGLPVATPTTGAGAGAAVPSPVSAAPAAPLAGAVPAAGVGPRLATAQAMGLAPAAAPVAPADAEVAAAVAGLTGRAPAAPAPEAVAAAVGAGGVDGAAPLTGSPAAAPVAARPLGEILATAAAAPRPAPPTPPLVPATEGSAEAQAAAAQSQASQVVANINGQEITAGQVATLPPQEQAMVMGLADFQAFAEENVSPPVRRMLADPDTSPTRKAQALSRIQSQILNDPMLRAVPEQQQSLLIGLQTMAGL